MRLFDHINRLLEFLLVLLLCAMVIMVFGNVVMRYVFHSGISAIEELSRYAFVWSTLIGGVVLLRQKGHLTFDTVIRRLNKGGQLFCQIACQLLIIFIAAVLCTGGWAQMSSNMGKTAQSSGFPMELFYAIGPLAGVLMLVSSIEQLMTLVYLTAFPEKKLRIVQSSERKSQ